MKSAVLRTYRSDLVINETGSRKIDLTEVRIKTAYAGVSFTDRIIQQGLYKYQRQHLPLPYVPGFEASGIIVEVGKSVPGFTIGDKVVVLQRSGCFSSEIIAQPENIIKLPPDTDLAWAASLPVNFFTASHALDNIVKVFPESDILITSAAGGVGGMLIQLGSKEHNVTGLVGNQVKKEYVRQLGANVVLTYEEFFQSDQTFDLIVVASGKDLDKYQSRLKKNGKIVIYGFHALVPRGIKSLFNVIVAYCKLPSLKPFDLVYENKTVSGFNIIHLSPEGNEFCSIKRHFVKLLDIGAMPNLHKVQVYELEDINKALKDLASGGTKGKVVIKFDTVCSGHAGRR